MESDRTTWPPGHVVHMTLEGSREKPVSVATCDCGWRSRKSFAPTGLAAQDFAIEKHWQAAEGRRRIYAPPAKRVHRPRPRNG